MSGNIRTLLFFILLALIAVPLFSSGKGTEPVYNPASLIDGSAVVREVREVREGPLDGLQLVVKLGRDTVAVYLGPVEFLKTCEMTFEKGDQIQLAGSRVKFGGATIILAQKVRRGGVSLTLRDVRGEPNWRF